MYRRLGPRRTAILLAVALLAAGLPLGLAPPAASASAAVQVVLDGRGLVFDVPPIIEEGRVLVPLRSIFEALGAEVVWEPAVGRICARRGPVEIQLLVGCRGAWVGGSVRWLDVPARILGGRTLVPLRFVSEALGAEVSWDGALRRVTILSGGGPPLPGNGVGATVHFIDVGQGDAILIQAVGGSAALIDGGPVGAGGTVVEYLQGAGVTGLACVVATHPHADHIGGLPEVLASFPVDKVVDPGVAATSEIYSAYMDAVEESGAEYIVGRAGLTVDLGGGARLRVLYPAEAPSDDSLNAWSVAALLDVGDFELLLPGDLPSTCEMEAAWPADVLKVAHHGSSTSTSAPFLQAVDPQDAVILVGDNPYGHPAPATLQRLKEHGTHIYRTDLQGTIVVQTDGEEYCFNVGPWYSASSGSSSPAGGTGSGGVTPQPPPQLPPTVRYAASRASDKYHYPWCRYVGSIKPENLIWFDSPSRAREAGYVPCSACQPPWE
ncbi:MAG: MBL fold metallo-hydrolase [Acetobacteraceae bacterium]|nr:MBL fold metallo-hydrolase [Acetobacteraceae bacterium]